MSGSETSGSLVQALVVPEEQAGVGGEVDRRGPYRPTLFTGTGRRDQLLPPTGPFEPGEGPGSGPGGCVQQQEQRIALDQPSPDVDLVGGAPGQQHAD